MIYRLRVILDVREDVFRDIEIQGGDTLEDLHNAIVQAFTLEGQEMASFYLSDEEWNQGEEISLFDMSEGDKSQRTMASLKVEEVLTATHERMLYVYDFMNIKTFYVEVMAINQPMVGVTYPCVVYSYGDTPDYSDSDMEEIDDPDAIDYEDEYDDDYQGDDIFAGDDSFSSYGDDEGYY